MKFSNGSSQDRIVAELRRNLQELADSDRDVLRSTVSILTTGRDYKVRLPLRHREVYLLACRSWYYPEEVRIVIQLELIQNAEESEDLKFQERLKLLLNSEPEMILYILESHVLGFTSDEVFGNIRGTKVRWKIYPDYPRKPKQKVRHRGYRDKGTLSARSHIIREELGDAYLKEQQIQLERDRDASEDAIPFILNFIN